MGKKALYIGIVVLILLSPGCAYDLKNRDKSLSTEEFEASVKTKKRLNKLLNQFKAGREFNEKNTHDLTVLLRTELEISNFLIKGQKKQLGEAVQERAILLKYPTITVRRLYESAMDVAKAQAEQYNVTGQKYLYGMRDALKDIYSTVRVMEDTLADHNELMSVDQNQSPIMPIIASNLLPVPHQEKKQSLVEPVSSPTVQSQLLSQAGQYLGADLSKQLLDKDKNISLFFIMNNGNQPAASLATNPQPEQQATHAQSDIQKEMVQEGASNPLAQTPLALNGNEQKGSAQMAKVSEPEVKIQAMNTLRAVLKEKRTQAALNESTTVVEKRTDLEELTQEINQLRTLVKASSISMAIACIRAIKQSFVTLRHGISSLPSYVDRLFARIAKAILLVERAALQTMADFVEALRSGTVASKKFLSSMVSALGSLVRSMGESFYYNARALGYDCVAVYQSMVQAMMDTGMLYQHMLRAVGYHGYNGILEGRTVVGSSMSSLYHHGGQLLAYIHEHVYTMLHALEDGVRTFYQSLGRLRYSLANGVSSLGQSAASSLTHLESYVRLVVGYLEAATHHILLELSRFMLHFYEHIGSLYAQAQAMSSAVYRDGMAMMERARIMSMHTLKHSFAAVQHGGAALVWFIEQIYHNGIKISGMMRDTIAQAVERGIDAVQYGVHMMLDTTARGMRYGVEVAAWFIEQSYHDGVAYYVHHQPYMRYLWDMMAMYIFMYGHEIELRSLELAHAVRENMYDITQRSHLLFETTMKWGNIRFTTMSAALDAMLSNVLRYGVLIAQDSSHNVGHAKAVAHDYAQKLSQRGSQLQKRLKNKYDAAGTTMGRYIDRASERSKEFKKKLSMHSVRLFESSKDYALNGYDYMQHAGSALLESTHVMLDSLQAALYSLTYGIDYFGYSVEYATHFIYDYFAGLLHDVSSWYTNSDFFSDVKHYYHSWVETSAQWYEKMRVMAEEYGYRYQEKFQKFWASNFS